MRPGRYAVLYAWVAALVSLLVLLRAVLLMVNGEYLLYSKWALLLFAGFHTLVLVLTSFGKLEAMTTGDLSYLRNDLIKGLFLFFLASFYFPSDFSVFCKTTGELAECVTGCLDIAAMVLSLFLVALGAVTTCL